MLEYIDDIECWYSRKGAKITAYDIRCVPTNYKE
jgi:hypothetical protein